MPFKSQKQMRAAFGGYLGSEMKDKAKEWADETPDIKSLPLTAPKKSKGVRGTRAYKSLMSNLKTR